MSSKSYRVAFLCPFILAVLLYFLQVIRYMCNQFIKKCYLYFLDFGGRRSKQTEEQKTLNIFPPPKFPDSLVQNVLEAFQSRKVMLKTKKLFLFHSNGEPPRKTRESTLAMHTSALLNATHLAESKWSHFQKNYKHKTIVFSNKGHLLWDRTASVPS